MELVEKLVGNSLPETAKYYSNPVIQRVGYLLDSIGQENLSNNLAEFIQSRKPVYSFLNPAEGRDRINRNVRWKLFINEELEFDL